ncbi:TetR/AcrR family transcriptional regulator [Gordonia sp. (in: high G+C Gram-positive bacteria)]|uniref:TetR/AcrR family transcriptional regulator n=1 Tax=Gordonia sp. (in: high G+C Gram-positive bacteria) TaxID=84139 RepID=UPI003F9B3110
MSTPTGAQSGSGPGADGNGRTPRRRVQARAVDTKERILDAAAKVLIEEGFSAASTLHIQQVAGVSRGRLLHHFPSRAQLLSGAVNHLGVERMQQLFSDIEFPADPRERIEVAVAAMWDNTCEPYFWASMELWMGARTAGGDLRDALSKVEHQMGAFVRAQTDYLFGQTMTALPGYQHARELMLTSMRGARMAYSFNDRDSSTDAGLQHWQWLFESLLD